MRRRCAGRRRRFSVHDVLYADSRNGICKFLYAERNRFALGALVCVALFYDGFYIVSAYVKLRHSSIFAVFIGGIHIFDRTVRRRCAGGRRRFSVINIRNGERRCVDRVFALGLRFSARRSENGERRQQSHQDHKSDFLCYFAHAQKFSP